MTSNRNSGWHLSRFKWIVTGAVTAFLLAAAVPAAHASVGDASVLEGTWIGTYSGYDADGYQKGQEKIVISKTRGSSAKGTWQYRTSSKKKWSKPRPLTLSVFDQEETADGGFTEYISGVDELGIYTGKYDSSDDTLNMAYVSQSQDVLTLTFELKRRE